MAHHNDDRPEAVQKLDERLSTLHPVERLINTANFELNPEDVLLCSGIKSGTTWVQQIVHGLRSRGSMDFEEISFVIPTLEFCWDEGYPGWDLPQLQPRTFKSHLPCSAAPKASGKRILVTRNPLDAAVSLYYFYGNWLFELDELSLEDFVEWMIIRERAPETPFANAYQMQHLASWYPHRKEDNTLWLHYEDMIEDLPQCIRMISDFLQIGVGDTELRKLVEKQASFKFMEEHRSKFDIRHAKLNRNASISLPTNHGIENNPGKVRNGKTNEGKKSLSREMQNKIAQKWRSLLQPVTGQSTYEEMRAAINKELGRCFAEI